MTTLQEAASKALEAWQTSCYGNDAHRKAMILAMTGLGIALAQQGEQTGWKPTDAAIAALKRFEETCSDWEGYDIPKDTMRNLQAIGLVYWTHGSTYCITDFGSHVLAPQPAQTKQVLEKFDELSAVPVAWTNASWLSNPHAGHFSANKTNAFNVPLYTHSEPMRVLTDAERAEREKARAK